jgi:hypothetical protein
MLLIFRGAVMQSSEFGWLWVQPADADGRKQVVRLVPGHTVVYEAPGRAEADRSVAEVGKALKRGLASDAEWIDFSRLPESVEIGTVVLRGDAE